MNEFLVGLLIGGGLGFLFAGLVVIMNENAILEGIEEEYRQRLLENYSEMGKARDSNQLLLANREVYAWEQALDIVRRYKF